LIKAGRVVVVVVGGGGGGGGHGDDHDGSVVGSLKVPSV
jgi:hypothetical protein